MTKESKKPDSTVAPKAVGSLDAPLALPADQLELVAGGMMPSYGPFGPTNGIIRVSQ